MVRNKVRDEFIIKEGVKLLKTLLERLNAQNNKDLRGIYRNRDPEKYLNALPQVAGKGIDSPK